jgi:hypothetical protein
MQEVGIKEMLRTLREVIFMHWLTITLSKLLRVAFLRVIIEFYKGRLSTFKITNILKGWSLLITEQLIFDLILMVVNPKFVRQVLLNIGMQ